MENELHHQPATPEKIWATLDRIAESQKELRESQKDFDKKMKKLRKRMRETDRQMKETDRRMKETDRRMKETDRRFNSQWGKLMESLVEGDLVKLLQGWGITVKSTYTQSHGRRNGEHYEFDILAINGEEVVVVEVKTTLRSEDVNHFLAKLDRFRVYEPHFTDLRVYGAVAYLKTAPSVVRQAERRGLFVIRATGSSASIVNEEGFVPRVFGAAGDGPV